MRSLELKQVIPNFTTQQVFYRLCDFESYARYTDAVRGVDISQTSTAGCVCDWQVNFREGVLCWREQDIFIPEQHKIEFKQLSGDMEMFEGYWQVSSVPDGSEILFSSTFDLGMPSLADLLEPIASSALEESIRNIIQGLFQTPIESTAQRQSA